MPDGDIVHSGLRKLYQEPYKWLCEGKATSEECARNLLEKLKQDLKQKGNLLVTLSQRIENLLNQHLNTINETGKQDYATLNIEVERVIQNADGRHDLKELVLRAGKSVISDLRYGREVDLCNASATIVERSIHEVYESEFKERIPLTCEHHGGVEPKTLSKRIEAIQPEMNVGIQKFAKDAIKNDSVARLSLPRRASRQPIDMNEDLVGLV